MRGTVLREEVPVPTTTPDRADPTVTASVYAEGRLDAVVSGAIAPFWAEFSATHGDSGAYLWTLRYAKSGEHLKLRVHAPAELQDSVRRLLAPRVEALFARLPENPNAENRKSRPLATPIDAEDRQAENHPDRTLLWTNYERSQISLGLRPFLVDDAFVARLTRCLGAGFALVLARFGDNNIEPWSHAAKQGLLLQAVYLGLESAGLAPAERSLYALYHRDCLLRGLLKQAGSSGGPAKIEQTLELFRRQVDRIGSGLERIRALADPKASVASSTAEVRAWQDSSARLAEHLRQVCVDSEHEVDPFARQPLFPPLFKVFHGLANQLGLTPLNEALAHHLLVAALEGAALALRQVELKPRFADLESLP
jgi:hypothetical protein